MLLRGSARVEHFICDAWWSRKDSNVRSHDSHRWWVEQSGICGQDCGEQWKVFITLLARRKFLVFQWYHTMLYYNNYYHNSCNKYYLQQQKKY